MLYRSMIFQLTEAYYYVPKLLSLLTFLFLFDYLSYSIFKKNHILCYDLFYY
jgi:hypothetical protein